MTSLQGKRAVVTGGSAGIGQAIARKLCAEGARTVIAARREQSLRETAEAIGAHAVPVDLSNDEGSRALAAAAQAHLGGIDILVLASGVYLAGQIRDRTTDKFTDMLAANVLAPLALVRECLPALEESHGDIVFINSTVTRAANTSGRAMFAAGNHALKAIADGLRDEVNERGVRVASVYPGTTATDRIADIMASTNKTYTPDRLLQPEDVAEAVASLLGLNETAEVTDLYIRPRFKS